MEGTLGEIRMFAANWAPRGWMRCDGQELPISQWQALFSILGTSYGGDGRVTFALPTLPDVAPGDAPSAAPDAQPVNYIICVQGIYPARQ